MFVPVWRKCKRFYGKSDGGHGKYGSHEDTHELSQFCQSSAFGEPHYISIFISLPLGPVLDRFGFRSPPAPRGEQWNRANILQ